MLRRARVTLSALLVAAGLAVGGCGESERVGYERDLAEVGQVVDDALEALPEEEGATIGAAQVATIADELREAADQLDDLDPPSDARAAHARLERGLRGVARAFDGLAADLRDAESDEEQSEVFVRFATDQQVDGAFDDLVAAQELYADEGYRVFAEPDALDG